MFRVQRYSPIAVDGGEGEFRVSGTPPHPQQIGQPCLQQRVVNVTNDLAKEGHVLFGEVAWDNCLLSIKTYRNGFERLASACGIEVHCAGESKQPKDSLLSFAPFGFRLVSREGRGLENRR